MSSWVLTQRIRSLTIIREISALALPYRRLPVQPITSWMETCEGGLSKLDAI